jgi:hypothetical protein
MNREGPASNNESHERRIFWIVVGVLGLIVVGLLPWWWGVAAAVPIALLAWWVAYQSGWFHRRTARESQKADPGQAGGKHAA